MPPGRNVPATLFFIVAVLLVGLSALAQEQAPEPPRVSEDEPIHTGLIEEAEVKRLFIDVEAIGKDGRPMPGLVQDDFKIRLNYAWREIQSVDDLCPCTGDGSVGTEAGSEDSRLRLAEIDTRYVLYFDFAQLGQGARYEALGHARRWIEEVLQPGDEAMVVAHAAAPGLRQLSPFTSNPEQLLAAVDAAASDTELHDPFPDAYSKRLGMCGSGTISCYATGRKDYFQMRRSFWALISFLTRMDTIGGRKALLYFHQDATMFPGKKYPGKDADNVPDLIELVQEVAAASTSSRTEIHALVMGGGRKWTVNFGANISDGTGGDYNRSGMEVFDKLAGAGRGCRCIYRIGVLPPTGKTRVYRVKVKADGQSLPSRYRIHYRAPADIWALNAMSVLNNPEDDWGMDLQAALTPISTENGRWTARVQVAADLSRFPADETGEGREWEIGVLLAHSEKRDVEEMLGYARLEAGDPASSGLVVHERVFKNLPPGPYEVRAYVRDRLTDRYGGARVTLDLPGNGKQGGVVGPLLLSPPGNQMTLELPMRKQRDLILPMRTIDGTDNWISVDAIGLPTGKVPLGFDTWICDNAGNQAGPSELRRWISAAGETGADPATEFDERILRKVGGCTRIHDVLEPGTLPPGTYQYRLQNGHAEKVSGTFYLQ